MDENYTMPEIEIDHCVIHVTNWERSTRFYCDVLGGEAHRAGNGWSFRFGNAQLNCAGPGVHGGPVAGKPVQPGGSDLCFIWPKHIESAIAHLKSFSIEIEVGPVERFGSRGMGTSVYFRDPDGSLIEFISYDS